MEQNANALPKVTLGQYKGLDFTRRVRPVSEKAVELEASNLTRIHAPFVPVELPAARGMRAACVPSAMGHMGGCCVQDSEFAETEFTVRREARERCLVSRAAVAGCIARWPLRCRGTRA